MPVIALLPSLFACQAADSCDPCDPCPPAPPIAEEPPVALLDREYLNQKSLNQRAWEEQGASLAREYGGHWVLIAEGEVRGHWPRFEAAWKEAAALSDSVEHAFFYRAGVDDLEVDFVLSPFLSTDPHWNQLGRRIRQPWRLTIAAVGNTWIKDGKRVSWGDMEARLVLTNLAGTQTRQVRAVASNMFQEDLTLLPSDAEALGLGRFTAPSPAHYGMERQACEKVLLRLRIEEFDIDVPAMAFVLPQMDYALPKMDPVLPEGWIELKIPADTP